MFTKIICKFFGNTGTSKGAIASGKFRIFQANRNILHL